MKIIWCMFPEISSMIDRPFCRLGHFLPFYLTNNPQKLNFEKLKQKPGDIIILNKSTKIFDHMLYHSWDMAHGVWNLHFLFWATFCPFKAPGDITILPICTKN